MGYIHGFSDGETERLIRQAEFLGRWVYRSLDLHSTKRLLEVGCGVGAQTLQLRKRWPALRVVAIDQSEAQLTKARTNLKKEIGWGMVELRQAAAEKNGLAKESFDAAMFCWVLEHLREPEAALRETMRVLKPGGQIILTEVFNRTLHTEPRCPTVEQLWAAGSELQKELGGPPYLGPRLPELAHAVGVEIRSFRFIPMLGDERDPSLRRELFAYFKELLSSFIPQLKQHGRATDADWLAAQAELDQAADTPRSLFSLTFAQLVGTTGSSSIG